MSDEPMAVWLGALGVWLTTGCPSSTEVGPGEVDDTGSGSTAVSSAGTTTDGTTGATTTTAGTSTDGTTTTTTTTDSTSSDTGSSSGDPSGSGSTGTGGSTGGPLTLVVAEELVVDLDVGTLGPTDTVWTNPGTASDFAIRGDPEIEAVAGYDAVVFNAEGGPPDDAWVSMANAPATLVGPDPTRSIEVWARNPSLQSEETMVAWGRRGTPGTTVSINFGADEEHGAVTQWTDALDIGWNPNPSPAAWHYLVYTYDGMTTRVYVDGQPNNDETLGAGAIDTDPVFPIVIGAQNEPDTTLSQWASLAIARVRVHGGVLSDADVQNNFEVERTDFGL
jgi:hypothetical protein